MQRRILLTALIAAIVLAVLISAAALAKKNVQPILVAGTQQCSPPAYGYQPAPGEPGRWVLVDFVITCQLEAYNNEPMGTGIAQVNMNANVDNTYTGRVWGSYTITTTGTITIPSAIWQGTFEGYNSQYVYTLDNRPPDSGATVILGHMVGQGFYKGYTMDESVREWDNAYNPTLGAFFMEITPGKK
jgi:hypothetical protein